MIGLTDLKDIDAIELDQKYGAHHYNRLKTVIRKTKGAWLYTQDGTKILDCLAAYSAANTGHHHPKIVAAMIKALQEGMASVISNVIYTDVKSRFLEKLCTLLPQLGTRFGESGNVAMAKNGGVESVETSIKLMRYYGYKNKGIPDGKQEIITFSNNFHGRMITIISFSSAKKYKEGFGPLTPGFVEVPFGDLDAVEKAVTPNTCGILVEPMQGEGGMYVPPEGFMKGLREICDKYDLLLTADEIQVGMGRTGKDFAFQHENVIPDVVVLGKAISGGLVPLSVMVTNAYLMHMAFSPGSDGSTYGHYPLSMVAGNAALDVFKEEDLSEESARKGEYMKKQILDIASRSEHVKEVRGKGLFIGIEVNNGDAMFFCRQLLDMNMLANDSHGHTIRISPPLIIDDSEQQYILERLERVLAGKQQFVAK
ncbi:MAG TPA: aspartate aminotransferase family protein [candidate division Zixibacteria bacterium]|nr:aspartate aminotransferase family protein [candidate division Zixibacteria bacterium]